MLCWIQASKHGQVALAQDRKNKWSKFQSIKNKQLPSRPFTQSYISIVDNNGNVKTGLIEKRKFDDIDNASPSKQDLSPYPTKKRRKIGTKTRSIMSDNLNNNSNNNKHNSTKEENTIDCDMKKKGV